MGRTVRIYLPDSLLAALGIDAGDSNAEHLFAARISRLAERYAEIMLRHRPRFTRAEWSLILETNRGAFEAAPAGAPGPLIWANIHTNLDKGLARDWGLGPVAVAELLLRVRSLSHVEQVSLMEAIDTFWRHPGLTTEEAMVIAGIFPVPPPGPEDGR